MPRPGIVQLQHLPDQQNPEGVQDQAGGATDRVKPQDTQRPAQVHKGWKIF